MKIKCMLFSVGGDGDAPGVIAVSPTDDVWFVDAPSFTPEMQAMAAEVASLGKMECLGCICERGTE